MSRTKEQPILISYLQYADLYTYLDQSTVIERRPTRIPEIWTKYDSIPAIPPAQSPFPGTADPSSTVSGISGVILTQVSDNALQFESTLDQLLNMVPGNLFEFKYMPTLTDSKGVDIPYDPSVWVVDGVLRVLE